MAVPHLTLSPALLFFYLSRRSAKRAFNSKTRWINTESMGHGPRERGFLDILDIGYRRSDRPFWCTAALLCLRNKQRQFRDPPRSWIDSTERPILYSLVRLCLFLFSFSSTWLHPTWSPSPSAPVLYVFFTSRSLRFLPLTHYCPDLLLAFLKKFAKERKTFPKYLATVVN